MVRLYSEMDYHVYFRRSSDVISLGLEAVNMAVSNDLLVPLDDIITDDEELTAKKDQYAPSLLEGFTVNDSLYGLPRTELRQW